MPFNVNDFRTRGLTFHGARPTLFMIEILNPPSGTADGESIEKLSFMARATQIPPSIVESVPVGYFGREIKVSGDRMFPDWNVNIINDEDFKVRDMLEKWSMYKNTMITNLRTDREYKKMATITQFSKEGPELKKYEMDGIFPTTVGPIELSWDNKNQIETFDVTFAFDWWLPLDAQGGGIYRV